MIDPPISTKRTVLLCVLTAIVSSVVTTFVLGIYGMTIGAPKPTNSRVAFSELLEGVEQGRVEEIRVRGRLYTFRIGSAMRETLGPITSEKELRELRPSKLGASPPKVIVE
jgi:hypothetical protein